MTRIVFAALAMFGLVLGCWRLALRQTDAGLGWIAVAAMYASLLAPGGYGFTLALIALVLALGSLLLGREPRQRPRDHLKRERAGHERDKPVRM